MGIGQRHQIQLIRLQSTKTAAGNWGSPVEVETIDTWAEISDVSGGREFDQSKVKMDSVKRFLIRYRIDKYPNCDWRIRYQGQDWTVTDIRQTDEKRFYWQMTASSKSDV